jgi:hypothetical protein
LKPDDGEASITEAFRTRPMGSTENSKSTQPSIPRAAIGNTYLRFTLSLRLREL